MKGLLYVIYVVFSTHYVYSQVSFMESGPSIVKPSQTLDVTCTVKGFSLTDSSKYYSVEWVRQFPGKGLEWMGRIIHNGDLYYAQSLKGRTTITRNINKGEVYLKLNNVIVDDSGRYHCSSGTYGDYFDIWGPGTFVTVTSDGIINPQVFPLVPFHQEETSLITIGCLAQNYMPNPLSVVWNTSSGGTLSGEKNIQFPLAGNPLRYSLVSLMSVSSTEWDRNTYICDVKHFSSSIRKTIPKSCVPTDSPLTVHILQGSCFTNTDDQVELSCQGYNLTSKYATIKWFINEKERPLPQDLLYLKNSNLYALHSTVSISLAEWNNGVRVKCQMTDTKTNKSSEATARKCSEISNCLEIEVIMVPPTIENIYVQQIAPISCTAYKLKKRDSVVFEYNYPGAPATLNQQTEDFQMNLDGTYSVTSFLTVAPETWQSNTEFTCIFRSPGLSEPIIRTISKKTETKLILPSIAVFSPPPEDIAKDELCTMTCIAYDFYPQDIYMSWREDDMEVSKDQYVNSEPKRNNRNQSFSASSLLRVPCNEWKKGKRYGCLVGHEAMPMKFMKKDIDIHTGNPTTVNVSVVMSDTTMSCY